jgi:hypothetical protein
MQARYGMDRRPIGRFIVVGLVIIGFFVGVTFVWLNLTADRVQFRLLAWSEVSPERVDVTFEVRAPADVDTLCIVRAQDSQRIDLGYAEVPVPAGEEYRLVEYRLRTVAPAYAAEVLECIAEGDQLRVPGPQFPPGIAQPEQPWTE